MTTNYDRRLDALEATLGLRTHPKRVIVVYVKQGDDQAAAIAATKRAEGIAPDDESTPLVLVEFV